MNPGMIGPQQQPPPDPSAQQGHYIRATKPSTKPQTMDLQMYIAKGLELMSSQQTRESMLVVLKGIGPGKPVEKLANALVVLLQKLDASARKTGVEVLDSVKVIGAHELIQDLAKTAAAANIFTLDDDHIELAYSVAVQDYVKAEVKAGRINPGKLMAQMQSSVRKMPPKEKQEMAMALKRIQATAAKYNGGK
jgi:hypothetical protein